MSISPEEFAALPIFAECSPAALNTLSHRAIEVRYPPDTVVFLMGSQPRGWYVLLAGNVRVVRASRGKQHVLHTEAAGGTLGEVPLFTGATHPGTAIASEPTTCALFTKEALASLVQECPEIGLLICRRLAFRVARLVERLDERSRGVRSRLAEFLIERLNASPSGDRASLGMTQLRLAEELGTVREVVSREIRALVADGVLESLGGGRYRAIDLEALRRRAD